MSNLKKSHKAELLVVLILGQLFLVLTVISLYFIKEYIESNLPTAQLSFAFIVVAIILTITTLTVFNEIIDLSTKHFESKMAEQKLKDSQELVQVLRSNHHDFMNHLQILYSAAQLGKIDLVDEYFQGIVKEVKEISSISKIIYPEIAALIYSKFSKAEELTPKVKVEINTNLENLNITTVDLSRILGNLLDNALYALSEVAISERELALKIFENDTEFQFTVYNSRPVIPEEILKVVFDPGFTTKGNQGTGLGLYNVKQIVEKNHGSIIVESSNEKGTLFTVQILK